MGFFDWMGNTPKRMQEPVPDTQPASDFHQDAAVPGAPQPFQARAKVGLTDAPAADDLLTVTPYVTGLARFVAQCPTPMTVAIQGDWGSGKTTVLRMLKCALEANQQPPGHMTVVEFNTWQEAKSSSGVGLVTEMVRTIVSQSPDADGKHALIARLEKGAEAARRISTAALTAAIQSAAATTGPVGDAAAKAAIKEANDMGLLEKSVRELFEEQIGKVTTRSGSLPSADARVIVLVDDLDRLAPEQAVDVMESLKALLDVERCVFVLAVDFDVVTTGVKKKYPHLDDAKARAFFDKIIQLPFSMPTEAYLMEEYLKDALAAINVDSQAIDIDAAARVATAAFGNNPRAIKRLLNNFSLLRMIEESRETPDSEQDSAAPTEEQARENTTMLFGMLVLQSRFPAFYRSLPSHDIASAVQEARSAEGVAEEWGVEPEEEGVFVDLMDAVQRILPSNDEALQEAMKVTQVTQVAPGRARGVRGPAYGVEERRERLQSVVTDQAIAIGERLEAAIRANLGDAPFTAFGQGGKAQEWTLDATNADEAASNGRARARWGLITFNKEDVVLQLEGGARVDPTQWGRLEEVSRQVASDHGLRLGASGGQNRVRLLGIRTDAQVAAVAPIAAEAYRLRMSTQKPPSEGEVPEERQERDEQPGAHP